MTKPIPKEIFSWMVMLALLSGCATSVEEQPNYRIIHEAVLHADMRAMAQSLGRITQIYLDSSTSEELKTSSILSELDLINSIATDIGGEEAITNYSVLNRYIGAFLYDVSIAKDFVRRETPKLFPSKPSYPELSRVSPITLILVPLAL